MEILIADDEIVSRSKMSKLLSKLGHTVLVAEDGNSAWNIWVKQRPRILITDWVMPNLDGIELCKKIRSAEGSLYTYIIMVTSKDETQDAVSGIEAGADDFIKKPFIKEDLVVRIRAGERVLSFQTRDIVIFSLAKLAESRDTETGNHLERIRFYSKILAETLAEKNEFQHQLDRMFLDNIFLTSPLHDIGKVGIPDKILLKPGKLTDDEFEIMKNHSMIGYNTLYDALKKYPNADYLQMSADIARSHHEKFDGSGYPDGLKGEDIPLAARIAAIADVYDALINKRIYKDAFPPEMTRDIIKKGRGTEFDPVIVDAFLFCEDKFLEIYNQFKDN